LDTDRTEVFSRPSLVFSRSLKPGHRRQLEWRCHQGRKTFYDTFSRFDAMPDPVGRTDKRSLRQHWPCYA